jgi:hypothetical protein
MLKGNDLDYEASLRHAGTLPQLPVISAPHAQMGCMQFQQQHCETGADARPSARKLLHGR